MLASPLAPCLGSLLTRHWEPTVPTLRLPQRWDWQGFVRSVRKRVGGDRGRLRLSHALTEFYCLDPTCHFCVGCSNEELLDGKLVTLKRGVETSGLTPTPCLQSLPFLSQPELGSLEVISLCFVCIGGRWLGTKTHCPRKL
uniref:Uncharacterized protein n=1 Tax=Molossus molossus TaxID=27622 RepID=A0A7J8BYI0_MOLMO|nr:hypothetical protein HJG59_010051 [Molossus molossus]